MVGLFIYLTSGLSLDTKFDGMTTKQKTNLISLIILLVCLLATAVIYLYSGTLVIAILFAPPIVHWILKHKERKDKR